ncbi:hypothetical protein A3731_30885 [Roseovarius sp. HI0049]|nr:hypothetical protein A3731_30885 [Roseovarius sp. HI0049]
MTEELTYPDVVNFAVPFFIAAILAELVWIMIRRRGGRYETRDALTSHLTGAGIVAYGSVLGFVAYGFFMLLWEITPLDLGTSL